MAAYYGISSRQRMILVRDVLERVPVRNITLTSKPDDIMAIYAN
jgi:hypothetical protein